MHSEAPLVWFQSPAIPSTCLIGNIFFLWWSNTRAFWFHLLIFHEFFLMGLSLWSQLQEWCQILDTSKLKIGSQTMVTVGFMLLSRRPGTGGILLNLFPVEISATSLILPSPCIKLHQHEREQRNWSWAPRPRLGVWEPTFTIRKDLLTGNGNLNSTWGTDLCYHIVFCEKLPKTVTWRISVKRRYLDSELYPRNGSSQKKQEKKHWLHNTTYSDSWQAEDTDSHLLAIDRELETKPRPPLRSLLEQRESKALHTRFAVRRVKEQRGQMWATWKKWMCVRGLKKHLHWTRSSVVLGSQDEVIPKTQRKISFSLKKPFKLKSDFR